MNFDFSFTAGNSQSGTRKQFEGNAIYTVKFDGCEYREFTSQAGADFKELDIKFSNEDGQYTKTFFEPKDSDFQDTQGVYGPNPSNVKQMMLALKHLIDAINPELGKKIDKGEEKIAKNTWKAICEFMVENTKEFIGKETKIKLIKNNKGNAEFPGFFASYSREGKLYMNTNFIGDKIFFTTKELNRIKAQETAKPTEMGNTVIDKPFADAKIDSDMDFNI